MPTGFREIAAALRSAIDAGEHLPGSRLPTEHELADRYGVSRETVRRALAVLKAAGVVTSATSRGTVVALPPVRLSLAHYAGAADPDRTGRDLGPWETACAEQGLTGRVEMLSVDRVPAAPTVAARLAVPEGTEVVRRLRLMYAGEDLAQVQESVLPVDVVAGTALDGPGKVVGGLYAELVRAGVALDVATEDVSARVPTADEQQLLGLPDAVWVLETWRVTRDRAGRPVEVLRSVSDARRVARVYGDLPLR